MASRVQKGRESTWTGVKANSALVEDPGMNIVIFVMTTCGATNSDKKKVRGCVLPSVPARNFRGS